MNLLRLLRLLILATLAFGVASLLVEDLTQDSLPQGLRDHYYSAAFDQNPVLWNSIGAVHIASILVGWIGLWFLWNPARYILAISWAAGWLISPLLGPVVFTGWGGALAQGVDICAGAILVTVFATDLRHEFGRRGRKSQMEPAHPAANGQSSEEFTRTR